MHNNMSELEVSEASKIQTHLDSPSQWMKRESMCVYTSVCKKDITTSWIEQHFTWISKAS